MIHAAILCGGLSSRMGEDKGIMPWQGSSMVADLIHKVTPYVHHAILSLRSEQDKVYRTLFHNQIIIPDLLELPCHGPLKGICSIHLAYPQDDLLVFACDMPYISTELINLLLKSRSEDVPKDAILFKHDGQIEPLLGIYSASGLQRITQMTLNGKINNYSLKYIIEILDTKFINVAKPFTNSFKNINQKQDLTK